MEIFQPVFTDTYDPLKAGSIDGTDEYPHDKAISRALQAKFKPNKSIKGNPECTVFISRFGPKTTEESIMKRMKEFGDIVNIRLVKDIVTGHSRCYGFLEYEEAHQARNAVRHSHKMTIEDHEVLVELEKGRILKGWIPRRLGGGLGGKRESGQLRFGGKDRPFRRPIRRPDLPEISKSAKSSRTEYSYSERGRRNNGEEHRRSRSRERDSKRNRESLKDRDYKRH